MNKRDENPEAVQYIQAGRICTSDAAAGLVEEKVCVVKETAVTIDVDGVRREASLMLLEDVQVGDWVIVHAGFAIHKIDEKSAQETLSFLKEAAALVDRLERDGE